MGPCFEGRRSIPVRAAEGGYDKYGRVKLHNTFTGEAYEALVFMGPTYYQRLRHGGRQGSRQVERSHPYAMRQPTKGVRVSADCVSEKWNATVSSALALRNFS